MHGSARKKQAASTATRRAIAAIGTPALPEAVPGHRRGAPVQSGAFSQFKRETKRVQKL
jgi:hypothetical protein